MHHYVRFRDAELKAAKDLVEKLGQPRPTNYNGGPGYWLLKVDEQTAATLLREFKGATCKTFQVPQAIESIPDAEIILTKRTGTV